MNKEQELLDCSFRGVKFKMKNTPSNITVNDIGKSRQDLGICNQSPCDHRYIEAVADAIGDGYIRCHNCKEVLQSDIRKGYKGLSVDFNGTEFIVTTKEV